MKAVAKLHPTEAGIDVVDVVTPGIEAPTDVLVQVVISGISGSEVNIWKGTYRRPNGQPVEPGRILGYDPYTGSAPPGVELVGNLDDILVSSDIVTLHLPVTAETRGMIGAAQLSRMRSHAILVNTSRGALVRTEDLVRSLRDGAIAGAALDVLEREALDAPALAGLPNVILTPHMAYYSESSLRESQRKAASQIIKVLRGEPPDYPVN